MRLTTRGEYGLLALVHLARAGSSAYVPAEAIASAQDIPRKYLEHILSTLRRAQYVRSARGKAGGYRLAKPANKITLAEIVRLLDGAIAPSGSVSRYFHETTPISRDPSLVRVFQEIRDFAAFKLENTTLADVSR